LPELHEFTETVPVNVEVQSYQRSLVTPVVANRLQSASV
jgi:hypothetical protein